MVGAAISKQFRMDLHIYYVNRQQRHFALILISRLCAIAIAVFRNGQTTRTRSHHRITILLCACDMT